jgi:hypothetical protein
VIPSSGESPESYELPRFRLGPALTRSLAAMARNFVPFFVVGTLGNVPIALYDWNGRPATDSWIGIAAVILAALVLYALSQALIGHMTFEALRGRPARLSASIASTLERAVPTVIAALIIVVALTLGTFVFVVPGVIAVVMLFVTLPACVVERLGALQSLSRSVELTSGYRWQIFFGVLIVGIANVAVDAIADAALHPPSTARSIVSLIWGGAWSAYVAVLAGTVYHDLRVVKDDVAMDPAEDAPAVV